MNWKSLAVLALGLVVGLGVPSVQRHPRPRRGLDMAIRSMPRSPTRSSHRTFSSLSAPAYFRITDQFVVGDAYHVCDGATFLFSTVFSGALASILPVGDAVRRQRLDKRRLLARRVPPRHRRAFAQGPRGSRSAGLSAGFYTRLDTAPVPEPTSMGLFGLGSLALGYLRRPTCA